jgi:hypothetical protein
MHEGVHEQKSSLDPINFHKMASKQTIMSDSFL